MIKILYTVLVLLPAILVGQTNQQEINQQVWKPFIEAFNDHDADKFLSVHSRDLVRSPRDGQLVMNWDQYYSGSKKSDERDQNAKRKRKIELRFLERIASGEQAVDVGIYKTTYIMADGSVKDYYGKFLVVLRKENGQWKILVDTDSSEGGTINEQSFLSAKPLEY